MYHLKKLFLFTAILFIFFVIPSVSYAIPGQLNYNMGGPESAPTQSCIGCETALSACQKEGDNKTTLYTACQQQQAQQKQLYDKLVNEVAQGKKITLALGGILGIFVILSTILSIVLIRALKKKSPSSPI